MSWSAFSTVGLPLALLGGCAETTIRVASPSLAVSDEAIDWDEVIVGVEDRRSVVVTNEGRGNLILESFALDGEAPSFRAVEPSVTVLEPDAQVELDVVFAPEAEGERVGTAVVRSNDPARPELSLSLSGVGVDPVLELPEFLFFGSVLPGNEVVRELRFDARGTGDVQVTGVAFEDPAMSSVFELVLPGGFDFPLSIAAGTGLNAEVVYRPVDGREWDARFLAATAHPARPEAATRFVAGPDDPGDNTPPVVNIFEPVAATEVLGGSTLAVVAVAFDAESAPGDLTALLYAGPALVDTATPQGDGTVRFETAALPAGEVTLQVSVVDPRGAKGDDQVTIGVLDPEGPLPYVLSGGPAPTDPIVVDDDLEIFVDGASVFVDANTVRDTHPPVSFSALRTSRVRVVATDVQTCASALGPLTLHFQGDSQPLNAPICQSACDVVDACYDPSFTGPWPSVFLDQTWDIQIP